MATQQTPHLHIIQGPGVHNVCNVFMDRMVGLFIKTKIPENPTDSLKETLVEIGIPLESTKVPFRIADIKLLAKTYKPGSSEYLLKIIVILAWADNSKHMGIIENYDPKTRTGDLILGVIS